MKSVTCLVAAMVLLSTSAFSKGSKRVVIEKPVIAGEWQHIFNPNDTRSEIDTTWYTNDHCFTKGSDGKWHAYGIIGHEPILPWEEIKFFHISADEFDQPKWSDHGYAMEINEDERVLWAPCVYHEKGSKTWHIFYNTGNRQPNAPNYPSWGQMRMATSTNMFDWERYELNPMFSDPGHARDSFVTKFKGTYYYYYTAIVHEMDRRAAILLRTSPDLVHWSGPTVVHTQPHESDWGGDAESPYIVERDGVYYLFICRALSGYNLTSVYWSQDPRHFPIENLVCELNTHASELIQVSKDEWYISNTGWDKDGIYIAPLEWETID